MKSLDEELRQSEKEGLLRKMRLLEGEQASRVIVDGRSVVNLCSNNYLGLANHPALKKAASEAVKKYGTSAGASRLIAGNMKLHEELEKRIAYFKRCEAALVFNSGYVANLGIISALVGRGDVVFSDRLNHASIVDGILLSRAEFKRYPHRDMDALRTLLEKAKNFTHAPVPPIGGTVRGSAPRNPEAEGAASPKARRGSTRRLIVTDTVFSMDGDIAPLPEIVKLAREFDAMVMVDEAHATGVLGKNGRGAVEHFKLEGQIDIEMGTLGKALGSFGAYAAGSKKLIEYLLNKSRPFIYTTALPPAVLAAAIAALQVVEKDSGRRENLWKKVEYFRGGLSKLGLDTMESQTQIIPVLIGDNRKVIELSKQLFEEGIFIQGIRPPSVPSGSARLRVSLMATHTKQDLDKALAALKKLI